MSSESEHGTIENIDDNIISWWINGFGLHDESKGEFVLTSAVISERTKGESIIICRPEILRLKEVSAIFYICTYCVFTLWSSLAVHAC